MIDSGLPAPLRDLIHNLSQLPGVGTKTATRYALHLLRSQPTAVAALAEAVAAIPNSIFECSVCRNYTDEQICRFCTDSARDGDQLCVVEDPLDLLALEHSGGYDGRYFVLHGVLSPIDGVGPDELRLPKLAHLVVERSVREVIVATNASMEGDATASEIARILGSHDCQITRLARGLATGGDIEFVDARTLALAIEARRQI